MNHIEFVHQDGDTTIKLTQISANIYEVVLIDGGEVHRKETTTSYVRAVYEYLKMIANEAACYDHKNQAIIEHLPVLQHGSW